MDNQSFILSELLGEIGSLFEEIHEVLGDTQDNDIKGLASELKPPANIDAPILTLAFIGQYNSGKSTIISALTGEDVLIDADVCTEEVTEYSWLGGISLIDTPGIKALFPDHDQITYEAMDRADLLVFVITNELFDDTLGAFFKRLAFDENKAREILLVVNKMSQDPGTPEIKIPDIEKVLYPLTMGDIPTVFIDALSHIEAAELDDDPQDRAELERISRFYTLIEGLNDFTREKRLLGKLTSPMFAWRSLLRQAGGFACADEPEERAYLELLQRKLGLLSDSSSRLRDNLADSLEHAKIDLFRLADEVADSVGSATTYKELAEKQKSVQSKADSRLDKFAEESKNLIEEELTTLDQGLENLGESNLKEILITRVKAALDAQDIGRNGGTEKPGLDGKTTDWQALLEMISSGARRIGDSAVKVSAGPGGTASGSTAHLFIYKWGKYLGVNFKPWGAVRVADNVGKVGRGLSGFARVAPAVLGIANQLAQDQKEKNDKEQMLRLRMQIRKACRDAIEEMEREFWSTFEDSSGAFYAEEMNSVENEIDRFGKQHKERRAEALTFFELERKTTELIIKVQDSIADIDTT